MVTLQGEGGIMKCHLHNFSTDDPYAFHAHTFNSAHTETGTRPCEVPGCKKTAHFTNKPLIERAICQQCKAKLEEYS